MIDSGADGAVSRQEWEEVFGTNHSFRFWDRDDSGAIDRKEWKEIYMSRRKPKQRNMEAARASTKPLPKTMTAGQKAWFRGDEAAPTAQDHHSHNELDYLMGKAKRR